MLIASHKIQIHTEGANIIPSGGLSQLSPHPSEVCSEELVFASARQNSQYL